MLRNLYQEAELYWATERDIPADLKTRIRENLGGALVLHHKIGHGLLLPTTQRGLLPTTVERVIELARAADLRTQVLIVHPDGHKQDVTAHLSDMDVLKPHEGDVEFHFLPLK